MVKKLQLFFSVAAQTFQGLIPLQIDGIVHYILISMIAPGQGGRWADYIIIDCIMTYIMMALC